MLPLLALLEAARPRKKLSGKLWERSPSNSTGLAWIRKDADTGSARGRRTVSALQWTHNQTLFREVEEGMAFSMYFPSGLVAQASTCCSAALSSTLYIEGTPGSVIRGAPFLPPEAQKAISTWLLLKRSTVRPRPAFPRE